MRLLARVHRIASMHVEQYRAVQIEHETQWCEHNKSDKVFQIVLTYTIVHPRTMMIEFGHAAIALRTMLGAQRLAYDARRTKRVQRELVLLDKLQYGLLHLFAIGRQIARIGLVRFVEIVPRCCGEAQEQHAVERQIERDRSKIDKPCDVEPPDYGQRSGHRNVPEHLTVKK